MADEKIRKLTYIEEKVFSRYLEDDEKVFYIVHKHFWLIGVAFFKLSMLFIPSVFILIFFHQDPYVFLGSLALSLITFFLMILNWYNWYSDVFILTDKNILFIMWDSLVKIRSSRISYSDVESASVSVSGMAATIFKFGDLSIKTANNEFTPTIEGAKNASEAEQQILKFKKEHGKMDNGEEARIFKEALREIIGEYINKHENEKHVLKEENNSEDNVEFKKSRIEDELDKKNNTIISEHNNISTNKVSKSDNDSNSTLLQHQKINKRFQKFRLQEDEKRLDDIN